MTAWRFSWNDLPTLKLNHILGLQNKHHNTVKLLLGITSQGVVSFVSETWEGHASCKYATEHSGILNKLLQGDVVSANQGFDIDDSVGLMKARLHIPAFTKGKSQLSAMEVQEIRDIVSFLKIHHP